MHLFVLIPRFNNYLPNDLDFRAQQQKKTHQSKNTKTSTQITPYL